MARRTGPFREPFRIDVGVLLSRGLVFLASASELCGPSGNRAGDQRLQSDQRVAEAEQAEQRGSRVRVMRGRQCGKHGLEQDACDDNSIL